MAGILGSCWKPPIIRASPVTIIEASPVSFRTKNIVVVSVLARVPMQFRNVRKTTVNHAIPLKTQMEWSAKIFRESEREHGGWTGLYDKDPSPGSKEPTSIVIAVAKIFLHTSVQGNNAAEFGEWSCAGPCQDSC
jgi:hypothetical protein